MKDTVFTARRKKRELFILLLSFIAANIVNLAGIVIYGTPVKELITKLPVVFALTAFLYFAIALVRAIWWVFTRIYRIFNKS